MSIKKPESLVFIVKREDNDGYNTTGYEIFIARLTEDGGEYYSDGEDERDGYLGQNITDVVYKVSTFWDDDEIVSLQAFDGPVKLGRIIPE